MPAITDELLAELAGVTAEQIRRVPAEIRDALRDFLACP